MSASEAEAARGDLAFRLAALAGWRRGLLALFLGVLLAAALPPFHLLPAALVALTGLAWLISGRTRPAGAFLDGWWFGSGFSAAAFYWIANALLVDAQKYGWMYPLALIAIATGFGLFPAVAAWAASMAPGGRLRAVALGVAWLVLEWVRSWLFTGFPWNFVGTSLAFSDSLLQPAAWGGPWVLSAIVLAMALAPAIAGPASRFTPGTAATGMASAIAIIALAWFAGHLRLEPPETSSGPVLRLVQPNIEQHLKWDRSLFDEHFALQMALSSLAPLDQPPVAIIWPEAAIPYTLFRKPATLAELAAAAPQGGLIIVGAIRAEPDASGTLRARNSLLVFSRSGPVSLYDKHRLVPFGEYVPLRGLLPLERIVAGRHDIVAGPGPSTIEPAGLPAFGALICYEIVFPAGIVDARQRPQWLLNVTNDAWFGMSSGPHQHFEAARLRAVEQGLAVVRVANTGISGVIDSFGRVVASLPLGHRGVLDVALPRPLGHRTPYSRLGDWTLVLILFPACAVLVIAAGRRSRQGS